MVNLPDPAGDMARRELEYRSKDIIHVFNPLTEDFRYKWDSTWFMVPAQGSKEIERYLAMKYVHDICEYIIGNKIVEKGNKILEKHEDYGPNAFADEYTKQMKVWRSIDTNQSREEMVKQILPSLQIYVVSRYGEDWVEPDRNGQKKPSILSPMDQIISESMNSPRMVQEVPEPAKRSPGRPPKISTPTAEEVTQNEG